METEKLYCLKGHSYNGVWIEPGDPYTVRRRHTAILIGLGRATRTPPTVVPFPVKTETAIPAIVQTADVASVETAIPSPANPAGEPSGEETDLPAVDTPPEAETPSSGEPEDEKEALRARYLELYGKAAHGRTGIEKLKEDIAAKEAELNG